MTDLIRAILAVHDTRCTAARRDQLAATSQGLRDFHTGRLLEACAARARVQALVAESLATAGRAMHVVPGGEA